MRIKGRRPGRPKDALRGGWVENGIGHIPLTRGKVAFVDAGDLEWLTQWNWRAQPSSKKRRTFYAHRTEKVGRKGILVSMHRAILGLTDPKIEGDHKDQNGLNNQRNNLRIATHGQNMRNRPMQSSNTTGYKGVVFEPKKKLYRATIEVDGKTISLGRRKDPAEAYALYVKAAQELHGEFACLT